MKDKLLAEWFWIERWDGSPAAALPLLARGLYRELLTRAWRLGGWLPSDPAAIQRLARVTPAEWKKAWPLVAPYWHEDADGHLVNDTQLEVMAEARRRKAVASEHGQNAARARHQASSGHGLGNARAVPEHQPPSPSPTDSLPASPPTPPDRVGKPGEAEAARKDLYAALKAAHEATGQPQDELLSKASRTGATGAVMVNPEGVLSLPWLRNTAERLVNIAAKANEARTGSKARESRLQDYGPGEGPKPGTPEWDEAVRRGREALAEARRELEASRTKATA